MAKVWEFDPGDWPAKFGRKWLWTIFAERANHAKVVNTCLETGMTDLVILINDSPVEQPQWGVRTGEANTVALCEKARKAGLTVHLGTWLDPKEAYVKACAAGMRDLVKKCKAASIILDLEGEWRKRIRNHTEFVTNTVAPAFKDFPTPIGITSFAALPKEVVPALAWAVKYHQGYGQPQAYSVWQGKEWQKSNILQPDQLSSVAWRTWSPLTRRLVVLEAAYGNPIPGRRISGGEWTGQAWGVEEAIRTAAQRAEVDGFPEIGWWSEEALSKKSETARTRRSAIAEIKTTGRSLIGRGWGRVVKWGAVAAGVAGGIALAVRRGKR
jgi:hypothetical protein